MKLTNEHNMPPCLLNFCKEQIEAPTHDHLRVTELIGPPQIKHLTIKHWDELVVDVSSRVYALMGSAFHLVAEKYATEGHQVEQRLTMIIDETTVKGTPDEFTLDNVLKDFKTTSVWTYIYGKKEFEFQLNCYAQLERENGNIPKALEIEAFFRDWKRNEQKQKPDEYPPMMMATIPVPLWSEDETKEYMKARVTLHKQALAGNVPECTKDDMWERPSIFAVMKEGGKRSVKNFKEDEGFDVEDAKEYIQNHKDRSKLYVEHRPGERVRCEGYCDVKLYCPQYKNYLKEKESQKNV